MNTNSILLIGVMILFSILVYSIYNQLNYKWRIILIIIGEIVIGLLGTYYWKTDDIKHIFISTIAVTFLISIILKKYGEITGKLLLLILCGFILFSGGNNMFSVTKNDKNKEKTETQSSLNSSKSDILQDSISTIKSNNGETTKMSEEEIRGTKSPVLIEGRMHFYQNQFPDVYWPGGDGKALPSNGCSITSMADVLINFGVNETPETIVNYVNTLPDNYHKAEGGARHEMFYELTKHYELKAECIPEIPKEETDQVLNCLEKKGMVISLQEPGEFTNYGHYIVICNYNSNDNSVAVLDPNINNREKEEEKNFRYSLEKVTENCQSWWLFYPEEINL